MAVITAGTAMTPAGPAGIADAAAMTLTAAMTGITTTEIMTRASARCSAGVALNGRTIKTAAAKGQILTLCQPSLGPWAVRRFFLPAPDRKKPAARDSGFKSVINLNELKKPGASGQGYLNTSLTTSLRLLAKARCPSRTAEALSAYWMAPEGQAAARLGWP